MANYMLNKNKNGYQYTDPFSGLQIPANNMMYPPSLSSNLGMAPTSNSGLPALANNLLSPTSLNKKPFDYINAEWSENIPNGFSDSGTSSGLKDFFSKATNKGTSNASGFGSTLNSADDIAATAGTGVKGALGKSFGWSKGSGLTAFGKNLGKGANIGSGIMYGIDAIKGAKNVSDAQNAGEDLMTEILRSSASNPLASSFLSSDQTAMLNKIKRGSYDSEASFGDVDLMSLLGGAGKGALTGLAFGGIPGAIIGGLGGGLTSNLTRQEQDQNRINSELEGLYQSLIEAENQYNTMKRPAITGLGLQSRYQNMFM